MGSAPDATGQLVGGRYRLRRQLGHGGMGVVYEAWQEDLKRTVALKLLRDIEPEAVERFRREAHAAAALGNPHIVQIFDFRMPEDEPPFLVMELLAGQTLGDAVRAEGALEPARAAKIGVQVLSALAAAHDAGLLHRDIKPANIFLCSTPTLGEVAKVLDFGVVKLAGGATDRLTETGAMIGTLAYMSPEQARGLDLDCRTDVYAVAVSLYMALSGQRPYPGESAEEVIAQMLAGGTIPLAEARPSLDARLAAIIDEGMASNRDARYGSARAMSAALREWLESAGTSADRPGAAAALEQTQPTRRGATIEEPVPGDEPTAATGAESSGKSRSWAAIVVGALALGVLGATAWVLLRADGSEPIAGPTGAETTAQPSPSGGVGAAAMSSPSPSDAPIAAADAATAAPTPTDSATSATLASATPSQTVPPGRNAPPRKGAPGSPCSPGDRCNHGECVDGRCVCDKSLTLCGGECVQTFMHPGHCGSCFRRCQPEEVCRAGRCRTCADGGFQWCGNRCVHVQSDRLNCGRCGWRCPLGETCWMGRCGPPGSR